MQQLREDVDRQKSETEALDERVKADLEEMCKPLKETLDRHENDEEGEGGLSQLRAKVNGFAEEMLKMQATMEENGRVVGNSKSRTDTFEDTLRDLSRKCNECVDTVDKSQERLKKIEETSSQVKERQQVVEDSVAKKYEALWQDVLHAMEDLKVSQEEALRLDLQTRSAESRREGQFHIKYVTQLVASVHDERRKLAICKDLMTVWQQHTWAVARRKTGLHWLCSTLNGLAQRRQRKMLDRWVRHASLEDLTRRLREEYETRLQGVQQQIEDSPLHSRCDEFGEAIQALRQQKANHADALQGLQSLLQEHSDRVAEVQSAVGENSKNLEEAIQLVETRHSGHSEHVEEVSSRLVNIDQHIESIFEAHSGFALAKDVQTMMRDTLLIWNSIKQLDAAKLDKKDMDSFAVETSNRDRQSSRRLEDLQQAVTEKLREETLRVQEKCSELDVKVGDSAKQFHHWEQMWEKLAGFVEELVVKVGDLQGGTQSRLHSTPLRSGSRPPSARTRLGNSDAPSFQQHASERSLHESWATVEHVAVSGAETTAESRMLAVGSAKALGELEQAVTQQKVSIAARSRPMRPMSAGTARRAADRGR